MGAAPFLNLFLINILRMTKLFHIIESILNCSNTTQSVIAICSADHLVYLLQCDQFGQKWIYKYLFYPLHTTQYTTLYN